MSHASTNNQNQPLHVVYGGANLFTAQTLPKLCSIALDVFERHLTVPERLVVVFGIEPQVSERVHSRVMKRIASEAIADYRIDFEDGYGIRSDEEEDGHAEAAARETARASEEGTLPQYFGLRVRSFSEGTQARAKRTLELYLSAIADSCGRLPDGFAVTLPKVESPQQVAELAGLLEASESRHGWADGSIKIEIMAESPAAFFASDGRIALPGMVEAGRGRVRGVHFGAYDHTASLGLAASAQHLFHQSCDFARNIMQLSLASTGVWLSDGATNVMPVAVHRGLDLTDAQMAENLRSVEQGLRLHFDNVRRSLSNGFYQGWDLHPAQIPARLAAVYSFYLEELDAMAKRLSSFVERATRASMVGSMFDDAATGEGLLNFFRRGHASGIFTDDDIRAAGLTIDTLYLPFREIVRDRDAGAS